MQAWVADIVKIDSDSRSADQWRLLAEHRADAMLAGYDLSPSQFTPYVHAIVAAAEHELCWDDCNYWHFFLDRFCLDAMYMQANPLVLYRSPRGRIRLVVSNG